MNCNDILLRMGLGSVFTLNLELEVTHAYHFTPFFGLANQLISQSSSNTFEVLVPEFFFKSINQLIAHWSIICGEDWFSVVSCIDDF